MINKLLGIAISTYNRPQIIRQSILQMLDEIKKYSIPIYISDDSTDFQTKEMIDELKLMHYENIYYTKNETNLGHDLNCIKALTQPETEYIWYLGDSRTIIPGGIAKIIDIIKNNNSNFIVVNSTNRNFSLTSGTYDLDFFFLNISWHATLSGSTIYKKAAINFSKSSDYLNSNFMQLGLFISSMIEDSSKNMFYFDEKLVDQVNLSKKSYWISNSIRVFAHDWVNFISSFDYFDAKKREYAIKTHSKYTGILKTKDLLSLRLKKLYNYTLYKKYKKELLIASDLSNILLYLYSIFPIFILKIIKKVVG